MAKKKKYPKPSAREITVNEPKALFSDKLLWFLAAFCLGPCALLFFTNLTRNPYSAQVTLVSLLILAFMAVWAIKSFKNNALSYIKSPLDLPVAVYAAVCVLSAAAAFIVADKTDRSPVLNETFRSVIFLLVNCLFAYFMGKKIKTEEGFNAKISDAVYILLWALCWFIYPAFRGGKMTDAVISNLLDPFGVVLWVAAVWLVWRSVTGKFSQVLHIAFSVGLIAAVYGVFQYFGMEFIWIKAMNPYGSRAISTFGNPNFMSSYLVMLMPFAVIYFVNQKNSGARFFYGAVFFVYVAGLMVTLTRSSWIGALVAMVFLFMFSGVRQKIKENIKPCIVLAVLSLLLVLFWPSGSIGSYSPSFIERFLELAKVFSLLKLFAAAAVVALLLYLASKKPAFIYNKKIMALIIVLVLAGGFIAAKHTKLLSGKTAEAVFEFPQTESGVYAPWHQRLLIWRTSADMAAKNPFTGIGFGSFELYYPRYQGKLLEQYPQIKDLRTHANNSHNVIIEVFTVTGILGLGVYLWIFYVFFCMLAAGCKNRNNLLLPAFGAAVTAMLADNLLNVSVYFAVPAFMFWFFMGCFSANYNGEGKNVSKTLNAPFKALLVLLLCLIVVLGGYYVSGFMRDINYFLGFKNSHRQNNAAAVKYLERALSWSKRDVNTAYELGNVYLKLAKPFEAAKAYETALKANNGYDEIYANLGLLYSSQIKDMPKALEYFEKSRQLNPADRNIYDFFGSVYTADIKNYVPQGLELYGKAVKMFPFDPSLWNVLGFFYNEDGQRDKAVTAFETAMYLNPVNQMYSNNYLRALTDAGKPAVLPAEVEAVRAVKERETAGAITQEDIKTANQYLDKHPYSASVILIIARSYYTKGSLDAAYNLINGALKYEPSNSSALIAAASILYAKGDAVTARIYCNKVLGKEPGNSAALSLLGKINSNQR